MQHSAQRAAFGVPCTARRRARSAWRRYIACTYTHERTNTHTETYTHAYTNLSTRTDPHTRTRTHTHTRMHAHTHTRARTHARAHTHATRAGKQDRRDRGGAGTRWRTAAGATPTSPKSSHRVLTGVLTGYSQVLDGAPLPLLGSAPVLRSWSGPAPIPEGTHRVLTRGMHTRMHKYAYKGYAYKYAQVCIQVCIHALMHACMHTCMHLCI
jgi:hypothetical protein